MKAPAPKPSTKPAQGKGKAAPKATVPRKPKTEAVAPAPVEIDQDAVTPEADELCGLTIREAKFIDIYLATFKVGQSYMEAGFVAKNPATAQAGGSRLLSAVKSREYLAKRSKAMFARMEEEQDRLMMTFTGVAYADPNELVELRRVPCRHCHGRMHRYQYTAGQWEAALESHEERREAAMKGKNGRDIGPLDVKGGVGYDKRREPHEDCPECFGLGVPEIILKDTRNLSPGALALYAGASVGKDGMNIDMHNQAQARDTLAKIRKMFDDKTNVTVNLDMTSATERFAKRMAEAQERQAKVMERRMADGMRGD